jgi:hypothetical protein
MTSLEHSCAVRELADKYRTVGLAAITSNMEGCAYLMQVEYGMQNVQPERPH